MKSMVLFLSAARTTDNERCYCFITILSYFVFKAFGCELFPHSCNGKKKN